MDHEKGNTLKVYIKQYLNRYKGCFALVAGIMIFYIFTLYLCGVSAADIRYFAGLEIVFLVVSAVFCGIRYWYRLRTVKRQIRDYMQGMQALSDTEDALEEVNVVNLSPKALIFQGYRALFFFKKFLIFFLKKT